MLSPGENEEMQEQFEMQDKERLEIGQEDGGSGKKKHMETVSKWNKLHCEVVSFPFIQLCRPEIWECAFTPFRPSVPKILLTHTLFLPALPALILSREQNSPA